MEKMSKSGVKVMRIAALLVSVIITLLLIGFTVLSYFYDWDRLSITITIIIAVVLLLHLIVNVWLKPIYKYRAFGYNYSAHLITVRKGFIMIKETRIPMYRIQNVDFNEGWIMRKYQLATLTLSTAGGNVDITLIDKEEAKKVMAFIKQRGVVEETQTAMPLTEHNDKEEDPL